MIIASKMQDKSIKSLLVVLWLLLLLHVLCHLNLVPTTHFEVKKKPEPPRKLPQK